MTGLIGRIFVRQFGPLRTGLQNPQDAVENLSGIPRWTTAPSFFALGFGKKGFDDGPLGVCEFHIKGRSKNEAIVDPLVVTL